VRRVIIGAVHVFIFVCCRYHCACRGIAGWDVLQLLYTRTPHGGFEDKNAFPDRLIISQSMIVPKRAQMIRTPQNPNPTCKRSVLAYVMFGVNTYMYTCILYNIHRTAYTTHTQLIHTHTQEHNYTACLPALCREVGGPQKAKAKQPVRQRPPNGAQGR